MLVAELPASRLARRGFDFGKPASADLVRHTTRPRRGEAAVRMSWRIISATLLRDDGVVLTFGLLLKSICSAEHGKHSDCDEEELVCIHCEIVDG